MSEQDYRAAIAYKEQEQQQKRVPQPKGKGKVKQNPAVQAGDSNKLVDTQKSDEEKNKIVGIDENIENDKQEVATEFNVGNTLLQKDKENVNQKTVTNVRKDVSDHNNDIDELIRMYLEDKRQHERSADANLLASRMKQTQLVKFDTNSDIKQADYRLKYENDFSVHPRTSLSDV